MKFSEIKKVKDFCNAIFSSPDWREVVENIGCSDFEVGNVRFIDTNFIDDVQVRELGSDLYILGCFNSNFLAEITSIDEEVFKVLQSSEAFEGIGQLIISLDKLDELQHEYSSIDGYGHHFNTYDGSEEILRVSDYTYHVFDNH